MTETRKRIQLISGRTQIDAIQEAARQDSIDVQRIDLPATDQRFGLVEVAAVVAIVKGLAEITALILKAWKDTKQSSSITIKTPKGTITIEGGVSTSASDVMKKLELADLL